LRKWDGIRALVSREFIEDFRTYLEQKVKDQENYNNNYNYKDKNNNKINKKCFSSFSNNQSIEWIDKLLQVPIEDYRKKTIDLIFVPYFIVVKKFSNEETIQKINEWLNKCDSIRKLDFNGRDRINSAIKNTLKKQIPPMSIITMKKNYKNLFLLIDKNNK
jgi:hypothetical protein